MQRYMFNAVPADVDADNQSHAGGSAHSGSGRSERSGLTGTLSLRNLHVLGQEELLQALERLAALMGWAQAQQARGVARLQALVTADLALDSDCDSQAAFRLAAAEVGALLSLPPMAAQRLVGESALLCDTCPATLSAVEAGKLSYRKAQIICSTVASLRDPDRGLLEARLLAEANGRTAGQLDRMARRLYEGLAPHSELTVRHRQAKDGRRVWLEPDRDGMCFLSACLPAPEGQAIFNGLTSCARAEQAAGDPRGMDQLRTDIFTSLLLGDRGPSRQPASADGGPQERGPEGEGPAGKGPVEKGPVGKRPGHRIKAEVMVLINAETILGLDDRAAELHGYGPISAGSARELMRGMRHWTGLLQDPKSGEILAVGRQRRIPPGLRRWLQIRDSTCRFPGCSANALTAEIDHTIPWARGGPTSHGNLECLCRKHHSFKTNGFWKARQPEPGVLEWTSPAGRTYRTQPYFTSSGISSEAKPAPPPF